MPFLPRVPFGVTSNKSNRGNYPYPFLREDHFRIWSGLESGRMFSPCAVKMFLAFLGAHVRSVIGNLRCNDHL